MNKVYTENERNLCDCLFRFSLSIYKFLIKNHDLKMKFCKSEKLKKMFFFLIKFLSFFIFLHVLLIFEIQANWRKIVKIKIWMFTFCESKLFKKKNIRKEGWIFIWNAFRKKMREIDTISRYYFILYSLKLLRNKQRK